MENLKLWRSFLLIITVSFCFFSCEDFVELETPNYKMTSKEVFEDDHTAQSALQGIYNELARASFSNGGNSSVTFLAGLSADNLENIRSTNKDRVEFAQNELTPGNTLNQHLWSSAYNIIYLTNSLLTGVVNSEKLSPEVQNRLEGEAKFVRAFTYFYLVNLYGDVPLILTTDFKANENVSRDSKEEVYTQIIEDLEAAVGLLGSEYYIGERTNVNTFTAMALLARVHLFLGNWNLAVDYSSQVINESGIYHLLEDPNEVFLAGSEEALWQISPAGRGNISTHTNEGNVFIIHPIFSFFATVKLDQEFVGVFEEHDLRLIDWIGYSTSMDAFFSNKYKIWNSSEQPIVEYSTVLRLAEQYFIRAEAYAAQGKVPGAIADLNEVRLRAGLEPIGENEIEANELFDLILEEKRKEFFAEWGHRWLDLKRTGKITDVLGENPSWQQTDVLYPIPASERKKNPQLTQNPGY